MLENEIESPAFREPKWWQPDHQTGWERLKAALRRDWEQTKADFTKGRKGTDLHQNVGDTLAQATGRDPIPPGAIPNPLTPEELDDKVRNAHKAMAKTAERLADDTQEGIRINGWDRWATWGDAERPLRYGVGAASFYTETWDDAHEARLRTEWEDMHPEQPWEDVRDTVREGWDRARPRF